MSKQVETNHEWVESGSELVNYSGRFMRVKDKYV